MRSRSLGMKSLGRGHPLRAAVSRALRDGAGTAGAARDGAAAARRRDGLVGLGEAVPLSLRGGGALEQVVGELKRLGRARTRSTSERCGEPAPGASLPCPLRRADARCCDLAARPRPAAGELLGADRTPEPVAVQRDAGRRRAGGGRGRGGALGRATASHLQAEARTPATTSGRSRGARGGRAARRGSGSTRTRPGTSRRRSGCCGAGAATRSSWPSSRWRRWRSWPRWRLRPRSRSPATRASRLAPTPSGRCEIGACDLTGVKLSKVGGPEAAIEIAEVSRPTSPAPSTARSGSPRRRRSPRRCARRRADAGLAHGLATQRLFASTIAAVECELRDGMLHPPAGPGLGVEIDEAALAAHRL